jgi:hypothetical protein
MRRWQADARLWYASNDTAINSAAAAGAVRARHSESSICFPAVSVFVSLVWMIFTATIFSFSSNLYDTTATDLMMLNLPILVFQITMMLLSSQFAKYEVVENLYALLDSKKSYVRYIRWA